MLLCPARQAQKCNKTPKALRDDIVAIGLAEDKANFIARVYKKNLVALSRAVVGRTLTVNQLTDMQWRFGGALAERLCRAKPHLRRPARRCFQRSAVEPWPVRRCATRPPTHPPR